MIWIYLAWLLVGLLFVWSFTRPGFSSSTQILEKYKARSVDKTDRRKN